MNNTDQATAIAHPNIALIKYWGKRDEALNLPATGSLSITLDTLWSQTSVGLNPGAEVHSVTLNGSADSPGAQRASRHLDLIRHMAQSDHHAEVVSDNNFPTAAGLASSASGFAALTLAAASAYGLTLDSKTASILARRGSGSAARSIYGGFAHMHKGTRSDGSDAFAEQLLAGENWPLAVVVAVVSEAAKSVGSTGGMRSSAATSPYFPAWVDTHNADMAEATEAIHQRDFSRLAAISESSCLKMHSVMMAGRPPLLYWRAGTMNCINAIRELREQGVPVFFTIDAGPQVKAVCLPEFRDAVADVLKSLEGVKRTIQTGLGQGARLVQSQGSIID